MFFPRPFVVMGIMVMGIMVMGVVVVPLPGLHSLGVFFLHGVGIVHHPHHRADVLPGGRQQLIHPLLSLAAVVYKHVRFAQAHHIQRSRLKAVRLLPRCHQQDRLYPLPANLPHKIIVREQGAHHLQLSAVRRLAAFRAAAGQSQQQYQRQHQRRYPFSHCFSSRHARHSP